MSKRKFVDFKAVKKAVSMMQILEHYALTNSFTRKGDSLSGKCPLHKGTNDTEFRVSVSKNCWNCFSRCQCGGNILDFVAKMDRVSILEAALRIMQWFNLPDEEMHTDSEEEEGAHEQEQAPSASTKPVAEKARAVEEKPSEDEGKPNKPLDFTLQHLDMAHPYLTERGLDGVTIGDFGLGFCGKGSMKGRIAIPIFNAEGQIVAYAGRYPGNPPEGTPKYKLPAGFRKSAELFNLDRARKEPADAPWVIVEGFFDCIHLWRHGHRKVVALMGSSMSSEQKTLLLKYSDARSRFIVMLDEDGSGRLGREQVVRYLSPNRFVRIAGLPSEDDQPEKLSADQLSSLLG